ncbi:MAG: type II toxin-antitoxin system VapC family toxin [Chloroflexi bacterium]|nr:type II toxin-antitoxin system VapC family toxin [Chloroflexota bacterium]
MIVVDANIIAYLFIKGERTQQARQLYTQDPEWIAPPLWQHEFLNVLATMVKQGNRTVTDALNLWHQAQTLMLNRERAIPLPEALILATTHGISAYDAQYATLADGLNCVLVTEDRRLVQKFPGRAMTMQTYLHHLDSKS